MYFKISHMFYYLRYWVGFYILPESYKTALKEYNEKKWTELFEESEKFKKELRSRKHIKLVKKNKTKSPK